MNNLISLKRNSLACVIAARFFLDIHSFKLLEYVVIKDKKILRRAGVWPWAVDLCTKARPQA